MLNVSARTGFGPEPSVYAFALTGLARLAVSCSTLDENIRKRLQPYKELVGERQAPLEAYRNYLNRPNKADNALLSVARHFKLTAIETIAVRLAIAVDEEVWIGNLLNHLQQPMAQSRPTLGLLAHAFSEGENDRTVYVLAQGAAARCGLLQVSGEDLPMPERQLRVSVANSLALREIESQWPGSVLIHPKRSQIPLGRTAEDRAIALGQRIADGGSPGPALIIRSGDSLEARSAAQEVCFHCASRAVLVHADQAAGMAPWLFLNGMLPVFSQRLAPGERKPVPEIPGFEGPVVVLTGPDGEFESENRNVFEWRLQIPPPAEREELWHSAVPDRELARRMGVEHRHAAGRIASLAAKAREEAGAGNAITYAHIREAARRGSTTGLSPLAELIADEVEDAALVVIPSVHQELDSLVMRCRRRDQFGDSLGPSIQARYRPSVRALFVGPSGTGKTLAVAWLATRLGLPLYRVDLSAVTSKYIGETEKNLSQLLALAEQNEVVLLFDEADALFGKRTDIQDANDRFANAQTNYLLQRLDTYDGIAVLTSNGRSRFDSAFSRRFDAIVSFPLPGPEERRALWSAHLGAGHAVGPAQLNRLSVVADLSGGQIRNAVLRAAVAASESDEPIGYRHLLAGVAAEYRKLGQQVPSELNQAQSATA
jgi:hypothetical protein